MPDSPSRYARALALFDRVFIQPLYTARVRRLILQSFPFWIASLLTGLVAVGYEKVFAWAEEVSFSWLRREPLLAFGLTPLAFLVSWALVKRLAPAARGSGIPQVMGGLLLALQIIGLSGVVGGLLGGLGLSAFLVGFAFKDIAENFLAGVILAFNRPFNVNDSIQVKDLLGRVMELNLRTTRIKTHDGKDIYVPNALVLKEPVTNFTRDGQIRQDFLIGIDYDADAQAVIDTILAQVKLEPLVLQEAPRGPFAVIEELATSTVNIRMFFWANAEEYRRGVLELRSRLMNRVKSTLLAAENVSLPSDIVEVQLPKILHELRVRLVDAEKTGAGSGAPGDVSPTPSEKG